MKRINVVGTSGSGKSTFSKKLATLLELPYFEMDAIFWGPNWSTSEDKIFFSKLEAQLKSADCWVLDGNYSRSTPLKWKYADTVIWLDYPWWRTTMQVTKRALWRSWTQVEIWEGTGNTESFKNIFTQNGIIWWSMSSYHRVKTRYETAFASGDYPHIDFVRLTSPKESNAFLEQLG